MSKKKKRFLAMILAISMVIPNVSYASSGEDASPNDAEQIVEETVIDTEDTSVEIILDDGTDAVTEEKTEDDVTEAEKEKKRSFDTETGEVDVSGIDFSSRQLLVGTEDESIFTWDTTVVSGYNGIYLTEYASEEETKNAYTYYYGKADFVDANITFTVSDNEEAKKDVKEDASTDETNDTADLSEINTGDDAISNLVDMDTTGTVPDGTIAVIDTGINGEGLVDSVSVIGESTSDDNGHGTRMYDFIKSEYPDAKILSIKALGSDGKGQVSDIYAAIQYAIEKKVSVINLSISAYSTAESDVIRNVIKEAVAQGIVVVGAAGNDGKNVRYFIPGNVDSAIIVGACDGNGHRIAGSNYGATVDYNVEADTTSEAAAKMSAIISRNDGTNISKVFTTDYSIEDKTGGEVSYGNSEFSIAGWEGEILVNDTDNYVLRGETQSEDRVPFEYYENNTWFDPGKDSNGNPMYYVLGGYKINCLCVDDANSRGKKDFKWDVEKSNWADEETKRVVYYAVSHYEDYRDAHRIVCRYLYNKENRATDNNIPDTLTTGENTDTVVNTAKNTAIPDNITFNAYYLANTDIHEGSSDYQNFITWKSVLKKDYYVAVKKVDGKGNPMNGVTFDIEVSGTTYSKKLVTGKDWNGTTYVNGTNGIAGYYLGKFEEAPTVKVTENWSNKWFVANTDSKTINATYTTLADAKNAASTFTYTNYSYAAATMRKSSSPASTYSMDGIRYELRRSNDALVATVTLNASGQIKSATVAAGTYFTETINGKICIGGLTYDPNNTVQNNYYWKEIETNDNYALDTEKHYITINKDNALTPGSNVSNYPDEYTINPSDFLGTDAPLVPYYVAVKKVDNFGTVMDGITFDVEINNVKQAKQLITGKLYNSTGAYVPSTVEGTGIGIYYLGRFTSSPKVKVTENWEDAGYVHNTSSRITTGTTDATKLSVYTTASEAKANAGTFLYTNVQKTYMTLVKKSSDTTCSKNNPNYSLAGATYKVYKTRAAANTALNSGNYGTALATLTVKADGTSNKIDVSAWMNQNPQTGLFLNTTFYLVESAAGKNYLRSTEVATVEVKPANTYDNPAVANVADKPIVDPFRVEIIKTDAITGSHELPEDKSLAGAEFRVTFYAVDTSTMHTAADLKENYSDKLVSSYTKTITINEITEGANKGKYLGYLDAEMPMGFIVLTEVKSPKDYSLTGAKAYLNGNTDYDITGNLVFVTSGSFSNNQADFTERTYHPDYPNINLANSGAAFDIRVDNTPIRGDIKLTKVTYANGTPLKNVEFVITNTDTGEQHSIFTDAKGNATTKNNASAWFSKGKDNKIYPYKAGYGSLPTGHYTIKEKRGSTNSPYQLLKEAEFEVKSNALLVIAEADGKLYNIELPYITTTAMDKATQSKTVPQGENQTIVDTIKYYHLRANSRYYIVGTLMVKHPDGTSEPYMKDGKPYTVTSNAINTPAAWTKSEFEKDGTYKMEFPGVNTADYEGCSFVVFQKLYYDSVPADDSDAAQYIEYQGTDEKIFPILHEDIDEEGQTVRPADVHTTIADNVTGDHIAKTGDVTVTDRVYYTGLTVGETYTVKGTLHVTGYSWKDADGNLIKTTTVDGEELLDADGNPVTAEKTFKASTDGYVDLEFTFDASLLEGESVVAFETIYYMGRELAVHADISDEDETVHFPNIHTTLYRAGTGSWAEDFDTEDPTRDTTVDESSKEVMAAENAVVVDRIKYHNLIAGGTYVVKGVLMDKASGNTLLDATGKKIEVEKTFTLAEVPEDKSTDSPDAGDLILADGTVLDMSADHSIQLVDGYFEVTFPAFDASEMGNKKAVAFEEVYFVTTDAAGNKTEYLISEHKNINDVDQTVRFVEIRTKAEVEETSSKLIPVEGPVTINDTVTYKNLIPGKEYTLTARPVVKGDKTGTYKDGDPLLDVNGKEVVATITFIPDEPDGEVVVPITFDGYLIPETSVVCYENMTNDKGFEIAVHNDIDDEDQTTYVVDISTTAKGNSTKDNEEFASEKTVIVDTVSYKNLIPGKEYKVSGTIMLKETGKEVLDKNGKPVTAETTFKAVSENGSIDITFPAFDGTAIAGKDIVVFEKLYIIGAGKEESLIAKHENINDKGQTVHLPEIKTSAKDKATDSHLGQAVESVTIIDTVTYKNLTIGNKYTVKGVLMVKETGKKLLDKDRKPVTAEKTFTAKKANGTIKLEFTFDGSLLEGKAIVVFEDLYRDNIYLATHTDIEDEDQTIRFPKVKTKARDAITEEDIADATGTVKFIDTVSYENLVPGEKYTVKGVLMNKETGDPLLDANANKITAETTFTATEPNGTVDVVFTFDGSLLAGATTVVFEDLYYKNKKLISHADIEDEDQTIRFPKVKTKAEDSETKENIGEAGKETTIIDTVSYENLIPGKEYTVKGVLVYQETGETLFDANGEKVTAEKTFTAIEPNGTVALTFTFDSSLLAGKTIIVFEDLYYMGYHLASHTILTDEDQSEHYPGVMTTAVDKATRDHIGKAEETVTIIDTVEYTNLIPGKEYTVKGVLMDKNTGEEFLVDSQPVTAEKTFVAEQPDGSIEIEFTFKGSALRGIGIVVFEDLFYKGKKLISHAAINDNNQTVYYPWIETKVVTDNKNKEVQPIENVSVSDDVTYHKLLPGRTYRVLGMLYDKTAEKIVTIDGVPFTKMIDFVPETEDGMITMTFTFDARGMKAHDVVVYEHIYLVDDALTNPEDLTEDNFTLTLVAMEEDFNNTDQTFYISDTPMTLTADFTPLKMMFGLLLLSGLGFLFMIWKKRRLNA